MMHGLIPGPFLFKEHPEFVWAVIASMYIGNVFLVILNLPLVGLWVSILKIPYPILFPLILAFTVIGAYSMNNAAFDVAVMTLFGVVGYILQKLDFPIAPIVLSLILGPLLEKSLRRSLDMSQGDFSIFFTSPMCLVLLVLVVIILLIPMLKVSVRATRNKIGLRTLRRLMRL
jgi:putative tricarboxylic transport membrane protein